ncbi:TniQ family protein [Bacillus sp. ISL-41]|uniref:TniQ family protein n=1 Tax=Bacillus sp. ISL-41 TaxID=2819127 RepID=UPI001BE581D0|nr:TniQ family protein [Bacillus sp. ISL-41]MBT2643432.1 TniQ family protein [Bacillus sp. ISL-41]
MNYLFDRIIENENKLNSLFFSRSALYNLEPIGIGTPYVESLTSYISRLALKHNVTISSLIKGVFAQTTNKMYLKNNLSQGIFGDTAQYINGNSRVSSEYVDVFERLTSRSDLQQLTMSSWTGIFSKNVVGKYRKWCPVCLKEWEDENKDLYEPLIWYISDITMCDKHIVELQEKCPNCNKMLPYIHGNFIVGQCQYCLTSLGNKFEGKIIDSVTNEEKFIIDSYKQLIEKSSSVNVLPTKESIGISLYKIMTALKFNNTNFAKFLNVSISTLSCWLSNRHIPSPESLLKIGWKINSTIYNLIYDDIRLEKIKLDDSNNSRKNQYISKQETEYHLRNEISSRIPKSLKQIAYEKGFSLNSARDQFPDLCGQVSQRYKNYNKACWDETLAEIEEKLLLELSQEIPLSLSEFIKKYGFPHSTVKRYYPNLCNKIVFRYKKYKDQSKIERTKRIKDEIKDVILDLHQQGVFPYRKLVQRSLKQPAVFRNPVYREYWEKLILQLGYSL